MYGVHWGSNVVVLTLKLGGWEDGRCQSTALHAKKLPQLRLWRGVKSRSRYNLRPRRCLESCARHTAACMLGANPGGARILGL